MTPAAAVRPRGPYSLLLSAPLSSDATRLFRRGELVAALPAGGAGRAWQRADGTIELRATDAADPAALLEPNGDWAELATVYLLAGWSRGLVPGPGA